MIQFLKEPLVENCSCKGCRNGVITDLRMPRCVYDKIIQYPMPMHIPKPIVIGDKDIDVEYMSFVDARLLPFTNKHQPSLAVAASRVATRQKNTAARVQLPTARLPTTLLITKLKNKSNFKVGHAKKIRGVQELSWSSGVQ